MDKLNCKFVSLLKSINKTDFLLKLFLLTYHTRCLNGFSKKIIFIELWHILRVSAEGSESGKCAKNFRLQTIKRTM